MNDMLNQSEVDALLAAVASGDIEETAEPTKIFSRNRKDVENVVVTVYNFKRPERVSKDQMRAIETLHEGFARTFGVALSGFLRTIVEVAVSSCDQMTYSEFIHALPNPTSFNLLKAPPLEGMLCLEISPLIIYPIIDRLLGGTNQELFIPQRALTAIEIRLINKITDRAVEALNEAWAGVRELQFGVTDTESNPHLVQIVPPNEVVIVVGFEVKMSTRTGTMNLCIPYNVIEPVMDDLSAQSWFSVGRLDGDGEFAERISSLLTHAALDVSGLLAETTITLHDLANLSVGDLIVTDKSATEPVVVCVEGEKKHVAHIGQYRGSRALKIDRAISLRDRL